MKLPFIQADIDAGSHERTRGQDRCPTCPLAQMFTRLVGRPCGVSASQVWVYGPTRYTIPLTVAMIETVGIADEHESQLVPRIFDFPDESWAQLIGGDA